MKGFFYEEKKGLKTLKCKALTDAGIPHGFSTRQGGVSQGYLSSLNFAYNREDAANVDENFRRFCGANGLPFESMVLTHQTHTDNVAIVDASFKNKGRERSLRDTDGLVTAEPGLGLVCFVADCVPILLADPKAKVVSAVHSGWRGTVAGIAARAVEKMVTLGADPQNIIAAIGPSIGPCCFEVGPEVQEEFDRAFPGQLPFRPSRREGHSMIDLWQACRLVLEGAGVPKDRIFGCEICTFCNNEQFYSHRYTNGQRGNLIGAIALEE